VNHEYDLFEKFPDGSSLWRACVMGLKGTRMHMVDLARRSTNQFYAMNVVNGKIVALELGKPPLPDASKLGGRGRATVNAA
jgi:hypothetical protein